MRDTIIIAGLASALALLSGCGASRPTPQTLSSILKGGHLIAAVVEARAQVEGSAPWCYGAVVSGAALGAAGQAAASFGQGDGPRVIPELAVDYRGCETAGGELEAMVSGQAAADLRLSLAALLGLVGILEGRLAGEMDCDRRMEIQAVIAYLEAAGREVLEELAAPDGLVVIEAVAVRECAE